MDQDEIERNIKDMFTQNYERLKFEGGHSLADSSLEAALEQVIYYYRKLKKVAEQVTETEVKLTLPNQTTQEGRQFTIEGIVDIVRENEEVWMYDIKTHDPDYIINNKIEYEKQINVYAYIFENLRGEQLNHTAIISTALPKSLQMAILDGDSATIASEFEKWKPLIGLSYDQDRVNDTISDFARIVDKIESCYFEQADISKLKEKIKGLNKYFGTHVCRNCDARFSCDSYREYCLERNGSSMTNYLKYYKEEENELEDGSYVSINLDINKISNFKGIKDGIEGLES